MYLDSRLELADATALSTSATGLALIGSQVDTSVARDLGQIDDLFFVVTIDTAVTSAGAATVSFILASDASAAIAVDGSASEHVISPAYGKATLVAGFVAVVVELPFEAGTPYERYLGLLQNVGTAALTAGKVNAFLTSGVGQWKALAAGAGF